MGNSVSNVFNITINYQGSDQTVPSNQANLDLKLDLQAQISNTYGVIWPLVKVNHDIAIFAQVTKDWSQASILSTLANIFPPDQALRTDCAQAAAVTGKAEGSSVIPYQKTDGKIAYYGEFVHNGGYVVGQLYGITPPTSLTGELKRALLVNFVALTDQKESRVVESVVGSVAEKLVAAELKALVSQYSKVLDKGVPVPVKLVGRQNFDINVLIFEIKGWVDISSLSAHVEVYAMGIQIGTGDLSPTHPLSFDLNVGLASGGIQLKIDTTGIQAEAHYKILFDGSGSTGWVYIIHF